MVREDILGGLKIALAKGQSLESAMQSFYNAGYSKEDIEDAARALHASAFQPQFQPLAQQTPSPQKQQQQQNPETQTRKVPEAKQDNSVEIFEPSLIKMPQTPTTPVSPPPLSQRQLQSQQIVSGYELPKKKVDFVTILLVIILIALLGVLAGVFFFKPQIVEFLNNYFE